MPSRSKAGLTRADLHVHTRASGRGATRWLDALGAAESYSEPERVYDLARARGMDLVAITDHDTIDGAMDLAERGFENLIIGEEVTTRLPPDGRTLHVLVWMIGPAEHDEIGALGLRTDAEALARWLREKNLPHALAHPLFDLSGGLNRAALERCLLLFGGFEAINGGHSTGAHRAALTRFLADATANNVQAIAERAGAPSLWRERWLTAGSDDHALLNLARAWTAAPGAHTPESFFGAVMGGDGVVGGRDATCETLAHQFVGVAGAFIPCAHADNGVAGAARRALHRLTFLRPAFDAATKPSSCADDDHRRLARALRDASENAARSLGASVRMTPPARQRSARTPTTLDAGVSLVAAQAPSVCAAILHLKERNLIRELTGSIPRDPDKPRVCLFADALDHTSGVSRFVLDAAREANRRSLPLTIFTCVNSETANLTAWPDTVRTVRPVGAVPTPGYADLRLGVPWVADLINTCAAIDPSVIHVSTPGPVGIAGALTARALGVPLLATHHTDYPAYAQRLLGSPAARGIAQRLLRLFYARCDRVLARSRASAQRLDDLGVNSDRVAVVEPGLDLSRFGPARRDPAVWRAFAGVSPTSVKALYVGRISEEKNLALLARSWRTAERQLHQAGATAELIVIGDGPGLSALRERLRGARAHFLGARHGDELATLYASCDFFLFPSTTDTLGQAVLEAQASGLPAVVSTAGGPAELIMHGRTGFTISAADHAGWARAIVTLARDAELRSARSSAACAHARRFSFERSFASFWSIHRDATRTQNHRAAPNARDEQTNRHERGARASSLTDAWI